MPGTLGCVRCNDFLTQVSVWRKFVQAIELNKQTNDNCPHLPSPALVDFGLRFGSYY
jgi:hypothetical protein